MSGDTLFMLAFGVIIIAYIFLYVGGRYYLRTEGFQAGAGGDAAGAGSPSVGELYPTPLPILPVTDSKEDAGAGGKGSKNRVLMEQVTLDPVAKDAIRSLDDYEYNLVFQNEGDRQMSTALRNKLMSQRPMDWAGMPPSSSQFQAGLRESFENATPTVPDNAQPFQNVSGQNSQPPDTESTESLERQILQTYKPPSAQELSSYDAESKTPDQLIHEIYDAKGLIPSVAHKEGTNVYEIVGVRRKDEKVVYEDEEAPAVTSLTESSGEARIDVPPVAADMAAATDPFYNDSQSKGGRGGSRQGKWDYQAWTPGLERMFAPTDPRQNWY
jgi:hypothetical protein